MHDNLDTVGGLIDALKAYRRDLPLEFYGNDWPTAVTLMHVEPDIDEVADGCYETLFVVGDTLATHPQIKHPSKERPSQ